MELIDKQAAIDALWKALHEYEDKTEKQFQESEDLDVEDWIEHRIFVQNMNDIDRQTILNLPSAQPEIIRCIECRWGREPCGGNIECFVDANVPPEYHGYDWFCPNGERRKRMIGIIEIDEEDISDDRHIILELPIEPERNGIQTVMRVKTNIKFYDWFCPNGERRTDEPDDIFE